MEISRALEILYLDYKKRQYNIGCMDRAIILCCIMRSKNLDSKLRLFYHKKSNIKGISHYVVIWNEQVYDCNEKSNPIPIIEYKEKKKREGYELVWKDSGIFIKSNNRIEETLKYLSSFNKDFQQEVKPLVREQYENCLNEDSNRLLTPDI